MTYLRAYLEAIMAEIYVGASPFQEDLHFAFLEYGGSLLGNYSFDESDESKLTAAAVANRICIVADLDDKKDRKHTEWARRAADSKGALVYLTTAPGREIENVLSPQLLRRILGELLDGDISAIDLNIDSSTPMGSALEKRFASHADVKVVSGWKAKSGTLSKSMKARFAKLAAKILSAEKDPEKRARLLGDQARALATSILNFIETHNFAPNRKQVATSS